MVISGSYPINHNFSTISKTSPEDEVSLVQREQKEQVSKINSYVEAEAMLNQQQAAIANGARWMQALLNDKSFTSD